MMYYKKQLCLKKFNVSSVKVQMDKIWLTTEVLTEQELTRFHKIIQVQSNILQYKEKGGF